MVKYLLFINSIWIILHNLSDKKCIHSIAHWKCHKSFILTSVISQKGVSYSLKNSSCLSDYSWLVFARRRSWFCFRINHHSKQDSSRVYFRFMEKLFRKNFPVPRFFIHFAHIVFRTSDLARGESVLFLRSQNDAISRSNMSCIQKNSTRCPRSEKKVNAGLCCSFASSEKPSRILGSFEDWKVRLEFCASFVVRTVCIEFEKVRRGVQRECQPGCGFRVEFFRNCLTAFDCAIYNQRNASDVMSTWFRRLSQSGLNCVWWKCWHLNLGKQSVSHLAVGNI